MSLSAGTRLGPYEIVSALGAGGMGEVYRARDTKLNRDVAIKVLPELFAADAERLARFQREAHVLASLNHPNIAHIHGLEESGGVRALVMELVEGEDLSQRIARGALPIDDALAIAKQIADALEAAHEQGIIHRDLKPANIKVRADGTVKVLDFGLAKALEPVSAIAGDLTASPTITSPAMTQVGVILGTAAYMSPEQAKGRPVDKRSDVWAFGCVLFELLAGHRAFGGETVWETIASLLEREPAWKDLPDATPPSVRRLLRRCLEKDPTRRLRDIGDARLDIDDALAGPAQGHPWLAWSVAALLGLTAVLIAVLSWRNEPPVAEPMRFELSLPPGAGVFTLSPDGRQLAFLAPGLDGHSAIWIRTLDRLEPRPLPGTENARGAALVWSSDSRFIAFQAGNTLKKINISGGPPQPIGDMSFTVLGGAWNRDDVLLLGTDGRGLMKVSAAGGVPSLVTTVSGKEVHVFPSFLPDGRHFVYLRGPQNSGICVGSLDSPPEQQSSKRVVSTPVMAVYVPPAGAGMGRLLFMREGSLLAQAFNDTRLEPTGEPTLLAEHVAGVYLWGEFAASSSGVLAYQPATTRLGSALTWFDREGRESGVAAQFGAYAYSGLTLSPDGMRVATSRSDLSVSGSVNSIWLLDLVRPFSAPFTVDPSSAHSSPVWSPDRSRIAFTAQRGGEFGIYQKATNGSRTEQVLVGLTEAPKFPNAWSRDGLLYTQRDVRTKNHLWILPTASDGTPSGDPTPFADSVFNESQGQFSPDGHWIAYTSDESGQPEIYVQPSPAPAGGGSRTPVSSSGGTEPRWRRDGRELFYLSPDGKLMAVSVTEGPTFTADIPHALFQVPVTSNDLRVFHWDAAPDGQRFLFDTRKTSSELLTVVLNWQQELKQRVPTK